MLKLVLWGTLIMASSLLIVLGLLLVLLAELYCSLLRSSPDRKQADEEEQPPNLSGRERVATSLRLIGLISAPPLAAKGATQRPPEDNNMDDEVLEADVSNGNNVDHFVYISNPIYDQGAAGAGDEAGSEGTGTDGATTPFETPDSSPSRLEVARGGGKEVEEEGDDTDSLSPPIAPMKKLPPRAASLTLSATTDSNVASSSSSSFSPPSNSLSW
ncbi:hypothetical protein H6P81_010169 [Aristolochia fimbriata]|uniref:Uncharacterized protein n=1 Tax=Aristolochia fimbriata TaxID=158543 RepID=A0AAV7EP84_ARIFI|nr:hypothetical protein H6P81_010169 [Aristolochia fimbriata]